jgi:hypothetical protein
MNRQQFLKFAGGPFKTSKRRLLEAKSVPPYARTLGKLFLPMATGTKQPALLRVFFPSV